MIMQDELEGWFGGNDHLFPVRVSSSPVSTIPPAPPRPLRGFDDDFTVFVSPAAATPPAPPPGKSSEDMSIDSSEGDGSGLWAPSHSYRSRGSGSEIGEEDEEGGGDDIELPTEEEIRAMSSRLFGSDDAFDMSRVVNELNEMKAEIAGMEDDGERRKAAARVALGLAHGIGG
jgi:hypothetical protein